MEIASDLEFGGWVLTCNVSLCLSEPISSSVDGERDTFYVSLTRSGWCVSCVMKSGQMISLWLLVHLFLDGNKIVMADDTENNPAIVFYKPSVKCVHRIQWA